MTNDPRVQKFYDEAAAAKKELRRLAMEISAQRIEMADMPTFPEGKVPMASTVIAEVSWALENGRTDLAASIIELVDQYNNSMGTAAMMHLRIDAELHQKAVQGQEEGDLPDYFDEDDGADMEPLRLSPEQAAELFGSMPDDNDG